MHVDGQMTKFRWITSSKPLLLTRRSHAAQRAITAEKALGSEREALVHRALAAEQATCALMEQHARDSAALRESFGHVRLCCSTALYWAQLQSQPRLIEALSRNGNQVTQPQQTSDA